MAERKFPSEELRAWFLKVRRPLPWRENKTPYRVLVSEVMLQQTQVKTVIPYFERWMKLFPTIEALANASENAVMKTWEGLGYYSRARSLHKGAKFILENFGGILPDNECDLAKIPGLGPYTISAILNFAFEKKKSLVDGNVIRVLSRYFAIDEFVDTSPGKAIIQKYAEKLLPDFEPWVVTEAMMEFGATVCQKKPACHLCPLQGCLGREKDPLAYPRKKRESTITHLERTVAVIRFQGEYLLQKGKKGRVMEGLYEFPYFEGKLTLDELKNHLRKMNLEGLSIKTLPSEKHSFTRYSVKLFPYLIDVKEKVSGSWEKEPNHLPFSAGHRRILKRII